MNPAAGILDNIVTYIIDPAILLLFSLGFLLFMWGLVEFLFKLGEEGGREKGRQHLIWGLIGMAIMISVQGIISLIDDTFSLDIRQYNSGRSIPNSNSPNGGFPSSNNL